MKIFDACGDADLAERQLGALFPELLEDDDDATAGANCPQEGGATTTSVQAIIGLLDFAGLTDEDPEIGEQLDSFSIPYMAVRLDDFLPADQVAEVSYCFLAEIKIQSINRIFQRVDQFFNVVSSFSCSFRRWCSLPSG